jgi:hypothetical protein
MNTPLLKKDNEPVLKKPVISDQYERFLEMSILIDILGHDKAKDIALKHSDSIEGTCNWQDNFEKYYGKVANFLGSEPNRLNELYLEALDIFDDSDIVKEFVNLGYDGAIYRGLGPDLVTVYRVF